MNGGAGRHPARDAVIVGGGPAGALAATLLARQGWGVLLADARSPGSPKTCGHCLNPRGAAVVRAAGLGDVLSSTAAGRLRTLRIHRPRRRPMEALLDHAGAGWLTPRRDFDDSLLLCARNAGVEIRRPASARLESATETGATVLVRTEEGAERIIASLVVGADGLNSAVARSAGLARQRKPGRQYGFSLTVGHSCARASEESVVDMFVLNDGYLGLVRQRDGLAHAAGLVDRRASRDARPRAFLRRAAAQFPALEELRDACDAASLTAAGPMPCRPRAVAAGPIALVGDAAGYQEPFTGEGMTWALESAALLGRAAATVSPGRWTDAAADRYARHWRREIGARQRLCAFVSMALERPALLDALGVAAGLRQVIPALAVRFVTRRRSPA